MITTINEFLKIYEVYDGDSGWSKRVHGGYGYLSGGSISASTNNATKPDADGLKLFYDKILTQPVYTINGIEYYFEHTDEEYVYFIDKNFIDNVDLSKYINVVHFLENYGDAYLQLKLSDFNDDNNKQLPL